MSKYKSEKLQKLADNHIKSTCTFTPVINEPPENIRERIDAETMFERDLKLSESRKTLVQNYRREALYDKKTLTPFFHPIISGNTSNRNRPENMTVFSHLYGLRNIKQVKIQNRIEEEKIEFNKNMAQASLDSNMLLDGIQNSKLETLFDFFDVDKDGFVTNSDIDEAANHLSKDVLSLMEVLIKESAHGMIKLSREEFLHSMNYLLNNRIIPEKHIIL